MAILPAIQRPHPASRPDTPDCLFLWVWKPTGHASKMENLLYEDDGNLHAEVLAFKAKATFNKK